VASAMSDRLSGDCLPSETAMALAGQPVLEGTSAFVVSTRAALALLVAHAPRYADLVARHIRRLTGLGHRDMRRIGRVTVYGRDRRAIVLPVDQAWIDRARHHCYVTPSIWDVAPSDGAALRRYAEILVHEAAHLYLDTHDETECNAEMLAAQHLLARAG